MKTFPKASGVKANVTERGARGSIFHAMARGELSQLDVFNHARDDRRMAADEIISLAPHEDALSIKKRGCVDARTNPTEIEGDGAGNEDLLGKSLELGLEIDGKEGQPALFRAGDGGVEKAFVEPGIGVREQYPAGAKDPGSGGAGV